VRNMPSLTEVVLFGIVTVLTVVFFPRTFSGIPSPKGQLLTSAAKPPRRNTVTFRLRGIPLNWDTARIGEFLKEQYGPTCAPTVKSLALEIHARSITSTIVFGNTTMLPNTFRQIKLPSSHEGKPVYDEYIMLDTEFHGITTLFAPPPDDHQLE